MLTNVVHRPYLEDIWVEIEEWAELPPKRGDHIRVKRSGLYSHHGIYVSDDEVIHFTGQDDDSVLDWSKCEVISTDFKRFLNGGKAEVKIYSESELDDLYPVEGIVCYARACIGDGNYNLAFNNCEHFANMCTLGRFRSRQVERVLSGKMPLREDKNMGIWSTIKSWFGGGSSYRSSSSHNYTYEPDKVKVAEIERDTKIRLAHMENERIELMKNARLDILREENEGKILLQEAHIKGFAAMAQTMVLLQEKLNEVNSKRLVIIEEAAMPAAREMEVFYREMEQQIQKDNDIYNTEKLPKLLDLLENYQEGTPQHKLFNQRIADDINLHLEHQSRKLADLSRRQDQIFKEIDKRKNMLIQHSDALTDKLLGFASQQYQIAFEASEKNTIDGLSATEMEKQLEESYKQKALLEQGEESSDGK